ncbi:MAG: GDP-mannose 4,6-dehydratase [Fibrobacteria bacterium]|nr:GDP-mannose 4,6-dehydratase [Fibrobacteria bacterium]
MSVLVTGGTGSLGYHLLSLFTKTKGDLISYSHTPSVSYRFLKHVTYYEEDLLNEKALRKVLEKHMPDEIYHIAAQNSVGVSQKNPYHTLKTNILGTQCLFECVRKVIPKSRIVFISSCELYGGGRGIVDIVHKETDEIIPLTPFATSKASCELLVKQYINAFKMDIIVVRPFHFAGPSQSMHYVLPSVARQIAEIEIYDGELVVYTGNLDISRDILDVRDLARGIALLFPCGKTGEIYNICSGKARTIRELVENVIQISKQPIDIRIDPSLERSQDIPLLAGSPEKMMGLTGWKPIISIEDSLKDLYTEMKKRIQAVD